MANLIRARKVFVYANLKQQKMNASFDTIVSPPFLTLQAKEKC